MKLTLDKYKIFVIFLFILTTPFSILNAQSNEIKTRLFHFEPAGIINISEIEHPYAMVIQNLEMPTPGGNSYRSYLAKLKQEMPLKSRKTSLPEKRGHLAPPVVSQGFEGNKFHGHVPNDNDLAISNDGKIVSVTNSIIYFYNADSMLQSPVSLIDFVDSFPQKAGKYDPKVIYDPEADRFVMCFLNGFNDSTSYIFMAFSKTNDPTKEWNIYTIPGNPLNDTSWSDFPMIALSKNELFFTINLLRNRTGNETWKTTFKQTVIWQFNKQNGYDGKPLDSRLYHDIAYEGIPLRNICPVKAGNELHGPNMYFLSNRNFSLETDSIFIVEITGLSGNPSTKIEVSMSQADSNYGVPPYADEPLNRLLETNDARILDAYFENDQIYFVGNGVNFENNLASFYLGKITDLQTSKTVHLQTYYHPYLEFGYPSIVYSGENGSDESIILVNHTADTVNPGVSALYVSDGKWSELARVKDGLSRVSVQSTKEQRWGDYTGLQRKYNEQGVVWGNGYWGKDRGNKFPSRVNATWICRLVNPNYWSLPTDGENENIVLYPNPAISTFYTEFTLANPSRVHFKIIDLKGRVVKDFGAFDVKKGKNSISFSTGHLTPGLYSLVISDAQKQLIKKIVIR